MNHDAQTFGLTRQVGFLFGDHIYERIIPGPRCLVGLNELFAWDEPVERMIGLYPSKGTNGRPLNNPVLVCQMLSLYSSYCGAMDRGER